MRLQVCRLRAPKVRKSYKLSDGLYTVGSAETNIVVLGGNDILDQHALFRVKGNNVRIEPAPATDDGHYVSVDGTVLSPGTIHPCPLMVPISFGAHDLYFCENAQKDELEVLIDEREATVDPDGKDIEGFARAVEDEVSSQVDIPPPGGTEVNVADLRQRVERSIRGAIRERIGEMPVGASPFQIGQDVLERVLGSAFPEALDVETPGGRGPTETQPSGDDTEDQESVLGSAEAASPSRPEGTDSFVREVQEELFKRLDIVRLEAQNIDRAELHRRAEQVITTIVESREVDLPKGITTAQMVKIVLDEALGLGPLEDLLADKTITEIMVVRRNQIYVERNGKIVQTNVRFSSDEHLRHAIERIVSSKGRRIDEMRPYVDTRLDDGSRVNAVIPPIAMDSPVLTIRKFPEERLDANDLKQFGSCTQEMLDFLELCVRHKRSLLISGGTGSGKTTLLNILSAFIPANERLVTIEDSAELNLPQEHVVRLESRPPNIEGRGKITIRDLVRNALRMRPDRILVGECRGGEAIDMLQAMNTGHEGSMTTVHANSPYDAIQRVATMCLFSGMELPMSSLLEQIALAIDLIVQTERMVDGNRRMVEIDELTGIKGQEIQVNPIYRFQEERYSEAGDIVGDFICVNTQPEVFDNLRKRRIPTIELGTENPDRGGCGA